MEHAPRRPALSPLVLVTLWLALCLPSVASAHAIGLSRGVYRATDQGLTAELLLARGELDPLLPSLDADRDGSIEPAELTRARSELESLLLANIRVATGAVSCSGALERAALSEQDGLDLELHYRCPRGADDTTVSLGLMNQLSHGHRHAAHIVSGAVVRDEICFGSRSLLVVPRLAASSTRAAAVSTTALLGFLRMGFEHILTGYDHLVFLMALLLTASRVRPLLLVVTAFTLGHSLSLALVVFGVVSPPASLVEPAIALSIAYVGAENLVRKRDNASALDRRWCITFPFGLVHGLGFASALREAAIPRSELPAALVTFNLGVELGQVVWLVLLLPVVLRLRHSMWFGRRVVPALSAAVIVAGLVWFVARLEA